MNSVEDIFSSDIGYGSGQSVEIDGWLVISSNLSYLTESETKQEKAILVVAPNISDLFSEQLPIRAGSMVEFVGPARVAGNIAKSGMNPLPYAFYNIQKIEFTEKSGGTIVYQPIVKKEPSYFDL